MAEAGDGHVPQEWTSVCTCVKWYEQVLEHIVQ